MTTARSSRAVPGQRLGVDTTHYRCSAPPLEPPIFLLIARLLEDKGICEYDRGRGWPRSRVRLNAWFAGGYPLAHHARARFAQWLLEETSGRPLSAHNDWHDGVLMLRYDHAAFCAADRTVTALAEVSLAGLPA